MEAFFAYIVSWSIGIDQKIRLQRRPDTGNKKFTEPVAITCSIALVTMSTKDINYLFAIRYAEYNALVYFYFFLKYFFQLPPGQGIVVPVQVMISENFLQSDCRE